MKLKTNVQLTPGQVAWLDSESGRTGDSRAALVRRAVNLLMAQSEARPNIHRGNPGLRELARRVAMEDAQAERAGVGDE